MTTHHDAPIIARLRALCAAKPHALAMVQPDSEPSLTYGELWRESGNLVNEIKEIGLGQGATIGLCVTRSVSYVVGMIGAWRAGAAWAPLPRTLPPERRAEIAQRANLHALYYGHDEPLSRTDRPFTPPASPDDPSRRPAYVLFTSGSTGRPRGVAVTHRGLLPMLDAQIDMFGITPHSRTLWALSELFDASISDIGVALCSGACLVIAPDGILSRPPDLLSLLRDQEVTHADLPPSLLKLIPAESAPDTLQTIIIGGESCTLDVAKSWSSRVRLVNVYGPTEATVCTSMVRVDPADWDAPYIGAPIPGIRYHLIHDQGSPDSARLLISGEGLAQEYLDDPTLNAQRFIDHDGRRCFDTGDRVTIHEDGALSFAGRIDRQIKVRGQLVAPEEIEAALLDLPHIARAAITFDGQRMHATVEGTCDPGDEPAIRQALARRLPSYMIPHTFSFADRLPRTATGKIDRRALPPSHDALSTSILTRALARHCDGVEPAPTDTLDQLGIDSLSIIEIIATARHHGLILDPEWFGDPSATIAQIAQRSLGTYCGPTAPTLRDYARSLAVSSPDTSLPYDPHGLMLVTGATGWLGSRLTHDLCAHHDTPITALVRARDDDEARSRLLAATSRWGARAIHDALSTGRLRAIAGDLCRPLMGLEREQYQLLASDVSRVLHSAALVNVAQPFEIARAPNLDATAALLRWCATGRAKHMHYISTLALFASSDRAPATFREGDPLDTIASLHGGYAQTKYAAEYCAQSSERALHALTIYRPGLITRDPHHPHAPPQDWLDLFLQGLAATGCAPPEDRLRDLEIDITPLDLASSIITHLITREARGPFHIAREIPSSALDLVDALRATGCTLPHVSLEQWQRRVVYAIDEGASPAQAASLFALSRLLDTPNPSLDLFLATRSRFDCTRAIRHTPSWPLSGRASHDLLTHYAHAALHEH